MSLALHGASAPVHDYHTGRPGSFEETLRRIDSVREVGQPVVVRTVLSRSTFRVLSDMPPLLRSRSVAAWVVVVPRAGDGLGFERLVPRLAMALPFALHALARAERMSLPAWIEGAPLCLLGPYARRALPTEARAYGEPCDRCSVRARCPGVDPAYLSRFGDSELRPLSDAPAPTPPPEPLDASLAERGSLELAPGPGTSALDRGSARRDR